MRKRVEYMAPVASMSGSLSGRQDVQYDAEGAQGYDVPDGTKASAVGYQPILVARHYAREHVNNFQVRTKTSVNMTVKARKSMAVMGGAGAIFTALLNMKSSTIYEQCVAATPKGYTLRGFLFPRLMAALAARDEHIAVADGVYIVNPWVSSETANVPVTSDNYLKFRSVLGVAWLTDENKQAIISTYGSTDGSAAIAATNDYLDNIAGTDVAKARQIAAFINYNQQRAINWGAFLIVYQPVEYIAATGTQYININLNASSGVNRIEHLLQFTNLSGRQLMGQNGSNGYWGINGGYYERYSVSATRAGGLDLVVLDNALTRMQVNGEDTTLSAKLQWSGSARYQIMALGGGNFCKVNWHYFGAFAADGTPKSITAPCFRNSDGKCGLYDLVTNTFYTNAGTGVFGKGANVIINI